MPPKVAIKIIEQTQDREFNRGKLINIGFALAKDEADYFSFHDVDYCPVRADYRAPSPGFWAALAYKGNETITDPRGLITFHDRTQVCGVIVFGKKEFEQVNGFANSYWGWGYEDFDLRARCELAGVNLDRRHGRYRVLPHINQGFDLAADGAVLATPANIKNSTLFSSRFPYPLVGTMDERRERSEMKADGLSSLTFSVASRDRLPEAGNFSVEKITVAI